MSPVQKTTLSHIDLTLAEASAIARALAAAPPPLAGDVHRWVRDLRRAALAAFPEALLAGLDEMRCGRSAHAGLRVTGLPIDPDLPPTPPSGAEVRGSGKGWLSESVLVAAAALIGEPYAVTTEATGLVSELIPVAAKRLENSGLGFGVTLGHHIENAALRIVPGLPDLAPSGLALLGLRTELDGGPLTLVADGRKALALMAGSDVEILRRPLFRLEVPVRWRGALRGLPEAVEPTPILFGAAGAEVFAAALYGVLTRPLNGLAEGALRRLKAALAAVEVGVRIAPGELVYVDNVKAFHARTAYEASFDAEGRARRWVQRVFIARSLDAFAGWDEAAERLLAPKG